jgi:uncharacterized protein (UPF0335 family)
MNRNSLNLGLPTWSKGVIAVAVIVGVGYGVYIVNRAIKAKKQEEGARKEENENTDLLKSLLQKGVKPTITAAAAAQYANQLFTAMDGYGTDWIQIGNILKLMKNDVDMLMVAKAYGIRKLSTGVGNPTPDVSQTLSQALTDELNYEQLSYMNNIFVFA